MTPKPSPNEIETRSAPIREIRIATNDDGTHSVSGYAIVFNSPSVELRDSNGIFTEFVAPGALTRSLTQNPDVVCLRDHKQELLLGRTTSGTLTLREDQTGLAFTCSLPATSTGNDIAESLRRGDIDACSFGFSVARDAWARDLQGNDQRTLLDVNLFEISIVSFPAYPDTTAALRSAPVEVRSRIDALRAAKPAEPDAVADPVCLCECPSCLDGNCADCSDADCDDEFCSCDNEERSRLLKQKRSELTLRLQEISTNL